MSTLTFQVPDEQAERLTAAAREKGVAVEELLRQLADDFLTRKQSFEAAAGYVLKKNAELYRRLAR
ncbi:MAG: ribbon-helix-helix protein, CopG family [Gemmataceae bacterium]|nr:ribbon-helix-helix protein, CopG family [Gemmataceae bacterium]